MITYLIVLRIVHIVAGVLWVGGAVLFSLFIEPSVKATAPGGQQFMQYFMGRRRFSPFMNLVSGLTVIAGALLFWNKSGGLQWPWIQSGPGLVFTFGAVVGIAVYLLGLFMIRPRAGRMGVLGQAIGANGGVPTSAQAAEMQQLDHELAVIGRVDTVLLIVALVAMAIARYVWF